MISAKQEVILFLIQLFEQKERGVAHQIAITKNSSCKCNCYKILTEYTPIRLIVYHKFSYYSIFFAKVFIDNLEQ